MHTIKFFTPIDFNFALVVLEDPPTSENRESLEMTFATGQALNDAINDLRTAQMWSVPSFKGPASWTHV